MKPRSETTKKQEESVGDKRTTIFSVDFEHGLSERDMSVRDQQIGVVFYILIKCQSMTWQFCIDVALSQRTDDDLEFCG